jgi:hypothetical protein
MLKTIDNQQFAFNYDSTTDSTVYVSAGVTILNGSVQPYRGGSITFDQMTNFDTSTNVYQYSALSLYNYSYYTSPDLTSIQSSLFNLPNSPAYPALSFTNITSDTSTLYPIGLFLFYYDGTTVALKSSDKIF